MTRTPVLPFVYVTCALLALAACSGNEAAAPPSYAREEEPLFDYDLNEPISMSPWQKLTYEWGRSAGMDRGDQMTEHWFATSCQAALWDALEQLDLGNEPFVFFDAFDRGGRSFCSALAEEYEQYYIYCVADHAPCGFPPTPTNPLTPAAPTLTPEGLLDELFESMPPFEDAATPEATNALRQYDDNGNGRITCAEAEAHGITPVSREHPAYPYMTDRDGDGVVCE